MSEQSTTQQIANLNNQVASDQSTIAASQSAAQNWKYGAIAVGVLIALGVLIFFIGKVKGK